MFRIDISILGGDRLHILVVIVLVVPVSVVVGGHWYVPVHRGLGIFVVSVIVVVGSFLLFIVAVFRVVVLGRCLSLTVPLVSVRSGPALHQAALFSVLRSFQLSAVTSGVH